jgi:asparagine synthase (glutamine-hydrolysing)
MCGIAGALGVGDTRRIVSRMTHAVRHRGPDDEGTLAVVDAGGDPVGSFGHRRLSILDLSAAGHQPMVSEDGRFALTFNGEIYNYRVLREDLLRDGLRFRSVSDTEVLLRGLARHGSAFVPRLRGMFAFALWDRERGTALLARDAFGIKPLYFFERGGLVLFASEVRSLLASGVVPRVLDSTAVRSYLATGAVTEPLTIVEGVRCLPAGTVAEVVVRAGRAALEAPRAYATPLPAGDGHVRSRDEATRLVQTALRESVALHLVSDVPVGIFLSGGLDSSAVAAMASQVSTGPVDTFNIAFAEEPYSEAVHARAVARRIGSRHHEIVVSGSDFLAALPESFGATDQPSMDGFNTYLVSRAVHDRGIKVVLSGLGGDELFAGYRSFHRAQWLARAWPVPQRMRRLAAAGAALIPGVRGDQLMLLLGGDEPARAAYRASRVLFGARQVRTLTGKEHHDGQLPPPAGYALLQRVSWYEVTGYMRNVLLRDSDVFSMAHGLELRVPFLDAGVAAAAAAVADSRKLRRGRVKPLLVDAIADLIPRTAWDRPKQGFVLPFAKWMRGDLHAEIASTLTPSAARAVGLDVNAAQRVWADFLRADVTWSRPWSLYTLVRWAREHDLSVPDTAAAPASRPSPLAAV